MCSRPVRVSDARTGRVVGGLVLLHFGAGLTLPYVLLNQAVNAPDFLASASQHSAQLRAVALLFMLSASVVLAISMAMYPVIRGSNERLALVLLGLGLCNLPLQLLEGGMILSMLSLGQQNAGAGAGDGAMLRVVAAAAYSARRWAHYLQLFAAVSWIFVCFASMLRARSIPRVLAVAGLLTSALQIIGVPVPALLGYPVAMVSAMPLGPVYVGLGLWLLVRGFATVNDCGFDDVQDAGSGSRLVEAGVQR